MLVLIKDYILTGNSYLMFKKTQIRQRKQWVFVHFITNLKPFDSPPHHPQKTPETLAEMKLTACTRNNQMKMRSIRFQYANAIY